MGQRARMKPAYLPVKLLQIRNALGLSQSEMLRRLGFDEVMDYKRISQFELGNTEAPLPVLLQYARIAGIHLEDLVDDELDLPDKLPGTVRYEGTRRKPGSRKNRR
jgi:transcriptional regulator with XRE-family HTH domain